MRDGILQMAKLLLLALLIWGGSSGGKGNRQTGGFREAAGRCGSCRGGIGVKSGKRAAATAVLRTERRELVHWILYTAQDNMSVEELLLVECSSESQAEQVLEAARERKATQIKNFEGYGPEQVQLLNQSVLRSDGVYVLFAVSDQAAEIKKAYRKDLFRTD